MDCNNYSYSSGGVSREIAQHDTVFFTLDCNYFNEWSYTVDDVLKDDSIKSFYIGTSLNYADQASAYEKAAKYYNSLVPDGCAIPLF